MNIIYLGSFRFPNQDAGAIRVLGVSKILRALGHNVFIISWGGAPRKVDNKDGLFFFEGFEYINTNELRQSSLSLSKKIIMYWKRGEKTLEILKQRKPDIIIAYNTNALFNKKCIRYSKTNNIKIISDITEWFAPKELGGVLSINFWLNEWNMRYIQKKIKNKIVISSYLANYYQSHTLIIPTLLDLNNRNMETDFWDLHYKNDDIINFIYAGSPSKKDLLSIIIKAFIKVSEKQKNIRFLILGIKDCEHVELLDRESKEWINRDKINRISFLGKVPYEVVSSYYQKSDFSVIIREKNRKNMAGFPTKASESLSYGCPILFNETSDLCIYLKDGINAIQVKKESVESVEEGLYRIISLTKEERIQMKKHAYYSAKKLDYRLFINNTDKWLKLLK